MLYRDFLKMERQFESAVNLGLDLNKHKKIEEYIPTDSSIKVLKEYLINIFDDTAEKATVLIGPYGKGKSHLLLILCALVSMPLNDKNNVEVLQRLIKNISQQNKEAAEIACRLLKDKKRFMPVIINGGYGNLQQTFLLAIKEALEREGLEEIIPSTYYDVAIEVVNKWDQEYPNTLNNFKEKLKERNYEFQTFIDMMKMYDEKAYNVFCEIHPIICSGSIFNPMINMDIVNVYKVVHDELRNKYDYEGMLIIFDEFSKFLDNTKVQVTGDLKILQDLAELTNRKQNQIYLSCITHKPIGSYTKDLSKNKALAYRAVEGRFKEIYFVSSAEQNYELIKNSIQRDERRFLEYQEKNQQFFDNIKDQATSLGIFPQGQLLEDIVTGCFPLHPVTTFMAIRISELVAQNERTLFTFLASEQRHTLRRFIESNTRKNELLTMDRLYDYFKDGFKKESSNEMIASTYLQIESLLHKELSKVQVKIFKAIALINMINQPSLIQATDQVLQTAINESEEVYKSEINDLLRQHYIFKRNSDNIYICLNVSTLDLRNKINECKQLKIRNINRKDVLTDIIDMGYVLPKQFNDELEMIRFFKNEFIIYDELLLIDNIEEVLSSSRCDGVIWYLIYDEEDDLSLISKKIEELADKRVIVYVPNEAFKIDEHLKEFKAIELLKLDKNLVENDLPVLEELNLYQQDNLEAIRNYISKYFAIDNKGYRWIAIETMHEINSKKSLSMILSKICGEVYSKTPRIASELINKHNISGPIVTARNKVITAILQGEASVTKGNSPDITITRATITNKGVLGGKVDDLGLESILQEIDQFIHGAGDRLQNIGELYKTLQRAPYGMRRGIIPIYLAIYFKKYSNDIIIYNHLKEVELNTETIKFIDKDPTNYDIRLEQGTTERIHYINTLSNIFEVETDGLIFHTQCTVIVEKIKSWFRSLPKCSRELQEKEIIKQGFVAFRKEVTKFDINPREFLLNTIPEKVCKDKNLTVCIKIMQSIKNMCDIYFDVLVQKLTLTVKQIFMPTYEGSLSGALKGWYIELDSKVTDYMLNVQTNKFLSTIKNIQEYDEVALLEKIGYTLTGLHLKDWTQETIELFIDQLKQINDEINNIETIYDDLQEGMQISIKLNGQIRQKVLKDEKMSPIGETLLSNLMDSLEEYGDALDVSEKMSVLVRLIETLM